MTENIYIKQLQYVNLQLCFFYLKNKKAKQKFRPAPLFDTRWWGDKKGGKNSRNGGKWGSEGWRGNEESVFTSASWFSNSAGWHACEVLNEAPRNHVHKFLTLRRCSPHCWTRDLPLPSCTSFDQTVAHKWRRRARVRSLGVGPEDWSRAAWVHGRVAASFLEFLFTF